MSLQKFPLTSLFSTKKISGQIYDIKFILKAYIIFMVHIPFTLCIHLISRKWFLSIFWQNRHEKMATPVKAIKTILFHTTTNSTKQLFPSPLYNYQYSIFFHFRKRTVFSSDEGGIHEKKWAKFKTSLQNYAAIKEIL